MLMDPISKELATTTPIPKLVVPGKFINKFSIFTGINPPIK